jgi:hypothetical protein
MALDKDTVWEVRTGGAADQGGCFWWDSLVNSTYRWTASGSGTNEYYVELAAGGDPSLTEATSVYLDGHYNLATNGTVGSLAAGEWDWGDNDSLGYSTVYVRLADGADPDSKPTDYVGMGHNGGTDYSQQDSAHATFTDLVVDAVDNTIVTSAATPFASDDVGNCIEINSGTGWTVGAYQIVSVSGVQATLDRSPGATGITGGNGKLGGARFIDSTSFSNSNWVVAGMTWYVRSGTHTLTSGPGTTMDGNVTDVLKVIGYNSTRGDNPLPDSGNQPVVACGTSNVFQMDDYWHIKYMSFTGSGVNQVQADAHSVIESCKSTHSGTTAGRYCFYNISNNSCFIGCHAIGSGSGTPADGFRIGSFDVRAIGCYAVDCTTAYEVNNHTCTVCHCIADDCTDGIAQVSYDDSIYMYNTFHNCTTGINLSSTSESIFMLGNDFNNCTTGISHPSTEYDTNYTNWNNYFGNTTDLTRILPGGNDSAVDPEYTDASGHDFSHGSNIEATGLPTKYGDNTTANIPNGAVGNSPGSGGGSGWYGGE